MKTIIFTLKKKHPVAESLSKLSNFERGELEFRHFPDGESYLRIKTNVKNKKVIIIESLDYPDEKTLSLIFFAETARELGAKEVGLVAPYLGYMRQDKRFNDGEAITSRIFASLISKHFDWLVTIDPHLHRYKKMKEIYKIPAHALHVAPLISDWIKNNIKKPVLIGPDEESRQWVSQVADLADAPFIVLNKIRIGDRNVKVTAPGMESYKQHQPVLIDDIISTARTMIETIKHLKKLKTKPPICIGVHAIFSDNAFKDLKKSGAKNIITCNTVPHTSNKIDTTPLILKAINI